MLRDYFFGAETLETMHAEMLSVPVLRLVVHQAIKIFYWHIMFFSPSVINNRFKTSLLFCLDKTAIKLFVLIAKNININAILHLNFGIFFYTNRELSTLVI